MEVDREFKIVTLGEGRVGKTSLAMRYVRGHFNEKEQSTTNANFLEKNIQINNTSIKLNIWDTAGQERFRALAPNYYREAKGALLVYDITDKESFWKVVSWVEELKMQAEKDISFVIAGNKCDLELERQIPKEQAIAYAKQIGAAHYSTSAKSGMGVNEIFEEIAKLILEKESRSGSPVRTSKARSRVIVKNQEEVVKKKKSGGCC